MLLTVSSDTSKSIGLMGSFTCSDHTFSDGTLTAGVTENGVALRHSVKGLLCEGECVRVECASSESCFFIDSVLFGNTPYADAIELSVTPKGNVRIVNCIPLLSYQAITLNAKLPEEMAKACAVIAGTHAFHMRGSEKNYDVTDNDPYFRCNHSIANQDTLSMLSDVKYQILTFDQQPLNCRITEKNGGQTITPKLLLIEDDQNGAYALSFDPYDLSTSDVSVTLSNDENGIPKNMDQYFKKLLKEKGSPLKKITSIQSLTGYYSAAMLSGVTLSSPKERAPQEAAGVTLTYENLSGETQTETLFFPLYDLVLNKIIKGGPFDTYFIHAESENGPWHIVFAKSKGDRVGLSLNGGTEMASQGKTYEEILKFYYPGAALTYISPAQPEKKAEESLSVLDETASEQEVINLNPPENTPLLSGDVNGDQLIDHEDLKLVGSYILGMETLSQSRFTAADLDEDGRITLNDVQLIGNIIYSN